MKRLLGGALWVLIALATCFPSGWAASDSDGFYHTQGAQLLDGSGRPVLLKGIGLGNEVWLTTSPPLFYHRESNYRELAGLGFNSSRFYLRADWFSGYNASKSFAWLDRNIELAKKHGIALILNIHIPPGGFQSLGRGYKLWENPANQRELTEVWRRIAARYAAEPGIVGYGILNEPWPTRSLDQWSKLAGEIVSAIREVDANHIVIVERPIVVGMDSLNDNMNGRMNFPEIRDSNIIYEFHFYLPSVFTHQNAHWLATAGVFARYPDESVMELCGNISFDTRFSAANPPVLGNSVTDWTYFEGQPVTVRDSALKIGVPVVRGERLGFGSVWFDDISVEEYDQEGRHVQTWNYDLNSAGFWLNNNLNALRPVYNQSHGGRKNTGAIRLSGRGDALNGATYLINAHTGHTYRINGWIKSINAPHSQVSLQLDFYASDGKVIPRNKRFIEGEMDRFVAFRNKVNAPVYLGEFGCISFAFAQGRGGTEWVDDVINACQERGIHYNFHDYYDDWFGLYNKYPTGTYTLNSGLYDLFLREKAEPITEK